MSTWPCSRVAAWQKLISAEMSTIVYDGGHSPKVKNILMVVIREGVYYGGLLGGSIRGQEGGLFLRVLTLGLRPPSQTMVDILAEINFGHAATQTCLLFRHFLPKHAKLQLSSKIVILFLSKLQPMKIPRQKTR